MNCFISASDLLNNGKIQFMSSYYWLPILIYTLKLFFINKPESIILFIFANFVTEINHGLIWLPSDLLTVILCPIKGKASTKSNWVFM